jgi:hypothetical protein
MEDINNKQKFQRLKFITYKKEQIDIIKKIFNIININKENNIFYSHLIDRDDDIHKNIYDLEENIKKYFKTTSWPSFKKLNVERRYLSIIKSICKDLNLTYKTKSYMIKYKLRYVNTTSYTFEKDDEYNKLFL